MTTARDQRRCALQALYQFDAGNAESPELVRESLEQSAVDARSQREGFDLAQKAWAIRETADEATSALTPEWPTYRQPVVDRSILRLAYYELITGITPPKVVINEAVELAREFSTEKSPLFVNGVLDKIYKGMRGTDGEEASETDGEEASETDDVDAAEGVSSDEPDTTPASTPASTPVPTLDDKEAG